MSNEAKREYQRQYMQRKRSNKEPVRPIAVRPNVLDPVRPIWGKGPTKGTRTLTVGSLDIVVDERGRPCTYARGRGAPLVRPLGEEGV